MTAVFETERLIVRRYVPDDGPFVLDMYSRWEVQQFLGNAPRPLQSLEEATAAIQRWRSVSDSSPLFGVWAVTLRTGAKIGTVMLKRAPLSSEQRPMPLSEDHEVGWHLHPGHWGHGYATEATAGALQRAFAAGVGEVIALIHPANERSKLVADRLGMEHMGMTNRYYSMEADLYLARPVSRQESSTTTNLVWTRPLVQATWPSGPILPKPDVTRSTLTVGRHGPRR